MKFNVSLDDKQIDQIANITADKVLSTVNYCKNKDEWYESTINDYKKQIQKRDSMIVQKDLIIERQREQLRKLRLKLEEYKQKVGD